MNQTQFVEAIRIAVIESSKNTIRSILHGPSGRQPKKEYVSLSHWFKDLSEADKDMVYSIIDETVETSVFGFLCVLDGVRAIESHQERGVLKLFYEKNEGDFLLNDPESPDFLHDLL